VARSGLVPRYEEFIVEIEPRRALPHEFVVRQRVELGD
jgi:hypothetical protein